MPSRWSPALLALALTGGVFGAPAARAATAPPGPIAVLVQPAGGSTLVAGTEAILEWRPAAGFSGLPGVEEWEAFLSLDGGATYGVRLTPHLDLDLRRIRFTVPALPTRQARVLLRFGDERREVEAAQPQSFAISAPAGAAADLVSMLLARHTFRLGEAARPGEAGVVAWNEGPRDGSVQRLVVATPPPSGLHDVKPGDGRVGGGDAAEEPPAPPARRTVDATLQVPSANAATGRTPPTSARPIEILLQTKRQNE